MRVIAGVARGFPLKGPPGPATRPTSDKVRGAIFDALAPRLAEARVLDLYAGTGALGIEALSRGATSCLFVEKAAAVCRVIEANLRATKLSDNALVWSSTVEKALERLESPTPHLPTWEEPATAVAWQTTGAAAPKNGATERLAQLHKHPIPDRSRRRSAMRPRSQAIRAEGIPPPFDPPYDILILDPPYDDLGIADVIERISRPGLVARGGFVVLEHGKRWAPPPDPGVVRLRRTRLYGDTGVTLWQREEEAEE